MTDPQILSDKQAFVDENRLTDKEWYTFLQKLISAISAADHPAGTIQLFRQNAAPPGWTKQTTHNDKALRVVSGNIVDGGSVAFSTVFAQSATAALQLNQSHMPLYNLTVTDGGHSHKSARAFSESITVAYIGGDFGNTGASTNLGFITSNPEGSTGSNTNLNLTVSSAGGGVGHSHNMDIRVAWIDIILATRDTH